MTFDSRPLARSVSTLLLGLAVYAALPSASANAQPYVRRGAQKRAVATVPITIAAGATLVMETRNLASGTDPVLHLWSISERTEVAFNDNGGGGTSARISYRNPGSASRSYTLLLRGFSGATAGQADIFVGGASRGRFTVRDDRVHVPCGRSYSYETAGRPDSAAGATMYGFDGTGRLRAIDVDSGVGLMSKLGPRTDICYVTLATQFGNPDAPVNLYTNDAAITDSDGDGLGDTLEQELRTCPSNSGCVNPNSRDSDRDGIHDAHELFGVESAPVLNLPAFGSDPAHKDVFVEIDMYAIDDMGAQPSPLPFATLAPAEAFATAVRGVFAEATAGDVSNPDGVGGVRVHLDLGMTPALTSSLVTVFGAWGGMTRNVPMSKSYETARNDHMADNRKGFFHYALMDTDSGGGQSNGRDAFAWGGTAADPAPGTFAHELGHDLGLAHHGHDSWGVGNCKPNYSSMMSYVFQNDTVRGFSRGENTVSLINGAVAEDTGMGANPSYLSSSFGYEVSGNAVDWNRDGFYHDTLNDTRTTHRVRAGINWAKGKGCGFSMKNLQGGIATSSDEPWNESTGTPALVRIASRQYIFYVRANGQLVYRWGTQGTIANGSCVGQNVNDLCIAFSAEYVVPTSVAVADFDVERHGTGTIVLAYSTVANGLRVKHVNPTGNVHTLDNWSAETTLDAQLEDEPDVVYMDVDERLFGVDDIMLIAWRDTRFGTVMTSGATTPGQWGMVLAPVDGNSDYIVADGSPTLVSLGNDETCMAVADGAATTSGRPVRMHCYDMANNYWNDVTSIAFGGHTERTLRKPALAFHRPRTSTGGLLAENGGLSDVSYGQLYMVLVTDSRVPTLYMSDGLSSSTKAMQHLFFRHEGAFANDWAFLHGRSTVALYEDSAVGALKGMWARETTAGAFRNYEYLPFVDGTVRETMRDGNDFHVMNRHSCLSLQSASWCGSASTNPFGY